MDENASKIIATIFEAVPAVVGLIVLRRAESRHRLFAFFILYGFVTDVLTGSLNKQYNTLAWIIFLLYTLIESFFFLFFLQKTGVFNQKWERLLKVVSFFIPTLFFPFHINLSTLSSQPYVYYGYFSMIYLMVSALFIAAAILFYIEENNDLSRSPDFFLLAGSFIYCFCTVTIDVFIKDDVEKELWIYHDITHIISYLLFTYAFILILQKNRFNDSKTSALN